MLKLFHDKTRKHDMKVDVEPLTEGTKHPTHTTNFRIPSAEPLRESDQRHTDQRLRTSTTAETLNSLNQIGRASCRERVASPV